jgi:ketohexokinase
MRILGVGVATLDIVDTLAAYPQEDTELRAESRRWSRGGNAANTLVVLSQLGHHCCWSGCLADDPSSGIIRDDFLTNRVDISSARIHPGGSTPASYILLAGEGASRTIIHYRDLPELDFDTFSRIDLSGFDWIHFEGRDPLSCRPMMEHARQHGVAKISLEVEKPREGIEGLFGLADVIIFSRVYAEAKGFQDARSLFESVREENPSAQLFAAWGEVGGWCQAFEEDAIFRPAIKPSQVIDTLGAGDVFNAGVIHALSRAASAEDALALATRLAGRKCGQIGFEGLGDDDG